MYFIVTSGGGFVMTFDDEINAAKLTSERIDATHFHGIDNVLIIIRKMLEVGLIVHIIPIDMEEVKKTRERKQ